jgi:hypothetical protein
MTGVPLETPVVLVVYNRPEHLRQVFAAVAAVRPQRLFLVADGPKDDADAGRCADARAVVERVDWPCEVSRNYADTNLGVMRRLPTGLDWVFAHVSEAIILEDDCVPAPTFFTFCEELLTRYRDDERVMEIGGSNFQLGRRRSAASYYFSGYACVYGWATWRRAWRHFDLHIRNWPEWKEGGLLESACGDAVEVRYWRERLDDVYEGRMTSAWDYQWLLAIWSQHGLSATPEVNLVSNIGFGPWATNTTWVKALEANLPTGELKVIEHPKHVFRHREADRFLFDVIIGGRRWRGLPGLLRRANAGVRRIRRIRYGRRP